MRWGQGPVTPFCTQADMRLPGTVEKKLGEDRKASLGRLVQVDEAGQGWCPLLLLGCW